MNQVFISNSLTPIIENAGSTTWASLAHTTAAGDAHDSAMMGIWDPYGVQFLDGTTSALSLIAPDTLSKITAAGGTYATDSIGADGNIAADQHAITVNPTSPQWLNSAFQVVQAMPSGNPVASPIIQTSQVKRLRWDPFAAPVLQKLTINLGDDGAETDVAVDDVLQLVVLITMPGDIAFYEAQINPGGAVTSVTPALGHAFDNPKRIYKSAEYVCASTTKETEFNAFEAAIDGTDQSFSDFVSISDNGAAGIFVEAKFFGMRIDAFVTINGNKITGTRGVSNACTNGVGSFAEVISNEKKAQYSQGFHNRMYLPTGGVTSASTAPGSAGTGYDRLVLEYVNSNSSMPGFNKAGNTSTCTLYTPNDTSFAAEATGIFYEDVFGLSRLNGDAGATAVEYNW